MNWSFRRTWVARGDDGDGIGHGIVLFEVGDDLGRIGRLLPDVAVDAQDILVVLVDHQVDGDGRLARLAVADNEFPRPLPMGKRASTTLRFTNRLWMVRAFTKSIPVNSKVVSISFASSMRKA